MSYSEALRRLLQQSHHARPEDLPEMAMQVAPLLAASSLVIYLVDHQQHVLTPLHGGSAPSRKALSTDGTLAGRTFSTATVLTGDADTQLWMPLIDGSERLGVLEISADQPMTDREIDDCAPVAAALAELVVTRSAYSDTIELARRRDTMSLPAEMLRAQLPPQTFSTGHMIISGILEPAYDVAGDAFDYAVNSNIAHLALFDAVGHGSAGGLRPVLLASIALAAYRHARRAGLDLIATYQHIDEVVRDHDRSGLITAVFAELDQHTGRLQVISAGHPGGIVLRDGKAVKVLPTPTALPVALGDKRAPVVVEEMLEPGDTVLLYTDGIIEARTPDGDMFGLQRLIDFAAKAAADRLPAPETVRRLVHAILAHQDNALQDDATVLLAQWHQPAPTGPDTPPMTAPALGPLGVDPGTPGGSS